MVRTPTASRLGGLGLLMTMLAGCGGSQGSVGTPTIPQNNQARNNAAAHRHDGSTTAFTVEGRKILLNGDPFFIKGVDYGNNQIDAYADPNPLDDANEPVWSPDLDAMRAAGAQRRQGV